MKEQNTIPVGKFKRGSIVGRTVTKAGFKKVGHFPGSNAGPAVTQILVLKIRIEDIIHQAGHQGLENIPLPTSRCIPGADKLLPLQLVGILLDLLVGDKELTGN